MNIETDGNRLPQSSEPRLVKLVHTQIGFRYSSLCLAQALNTETNEGKPIYAYVRVSTPDPNEITIFQVDLEGKVERTTHVSYSMGEKEIYNRDEIGHGRIPEEEFKKMYLAIGGRFDSSVDMQHKIEEIILLIEPKNKTERVKTTVLEQSDIVDQFKEYGDSMRIFRESSKN